MLSSLQSTIGTFETRISPNCSKLEVQQVAVISVQCRHGCIPVSHRTFRYAALVVRARPVRQALMGLFISSKMEAAVDSCVKHQ